MTGGYPCGFMHMKAVVIDIDGIQSQICAEKVPAVRRGTDAVCMRHLLAQRVRTAAAVQIRASGCGSNVSGQIVGNIDMTVRVTEVTGTKVPALFTSVM